MQFNSAKSSNPVVSTAICAFRSFAFLTVVFLHDATLSVQAVEITKTQFIGAHIGIFEAREVGHTTNTLLVKAKWNENSGEDYLKLECAILCDIEEKTAQVPGKYRHLVLQEPNYKGLQRNVPLPDGKIAQLAIVFPLFKEGHLRNLLEKAAKDPWKYPITKAFVLSVARGILSGLKLLHQTAGYVHGNLKPSTIFLYHRSENEMSASIADFSRASPIDEVATCNLSAMTAGYTPPEHFKEGRPVPRTAAFDVFSFGSVLYQLALGHPADEAYQLDYLQRTPRLPKTLRSIVIGCWNEVPHERPTIDQILEALNVYALDNEFGSSTNL